MTAASTSIAADERPAEQPQRAIEDRFGFACALPCAGASPTGARAGSVPRRVCCRARLPSGELWKLMRLGRCTRNAISSSPVQPTSPTSSCAAGPTSCTNRNSSLQPIEPIARPRERHEAWQLRDVADIEPDMDETPPVAAERAHLAHGNARALRTAGGRPGDRSAPRGRHSTSRRAARPAQESTR